MKTEDGTKFLTVAKLRELLAEIPDDWLVNCQSRAETGNLGIYKHSKELLASVVVEFAEEKLTTYE